MIRRTIIPLYLPCRGEGQDERGEVKKWEQTVGLVCCCVLPCLGFHRPDDYRLIPGDLSLTQDILPSVRLTEEVISLLQTQETYRGSYGQPLFLVSFAVNLHI